PADEVQRLPDALPARAGGADRTALRTLVPAAARGTGALRRRGRAGRSDARKRPHEAARQSVRSSVAADAGDCRAAPMAAGGRVRRARTRPAGAGPRLPRRGDGPGRALVPALGPEA